MCCPCCCSLLGEAFHAAVERLGGLDAVTSVLLWQELHPSFPELTAQARPVAVASMHELPDVSWQQLQRLCSDWLSGLLPPSSSSASLRRLSSGTSRPFDAARERSRARSLAHSRSRRLCDEWRPGTAS